MGLVKYYIRNGERVFNILTNIKDIWGLYVKYNTDLIGLKLRARDNHRDTGIIKSVFNNMGILCVSFEGGGWLCLDHTLEGYQVKVKGRYI